uniref:PYRUVATE DEHYDROGENASE E1 BETA family protein n=1 Tax=Rhizophora mucronata TaxID=61149 RepID=A0A2P2N5J4_RHIMU
MLLAKKLLHFLSMLGNCYLNSH